MTLRNDYDLDVRNDTLATVTKVHRRKHELTRYCAGPGLSWHCVPPLMIAVRSFVYDRAWPQYPLVYR